MKALITGANGQVGRALQQTAPENTDVVAVDRTQLDITSAEAVAEAIRREAPSLIINAAAYTAVDKAESESEAAYAGNAAGPENLARAARAAGVRLVHISTDFVFDGAQSTPYRPDDPVNPLCVYGASKAEGESRVRGILGNDALIVRTSWVYAKEGGNFVNTMLRLMRTKPALTIVADQIGTPTWAISLAKFLWRAAEQPDINGTHHYSDAGVASWYDFAVAIKEEALTAGLLDESVPIKPIASNDYPQIARRPAFSVLDKRASVDRFGAELIHWRQALRQMLSVDNNASPAMN
ncbi:MAG TPA: dTDP-4-dehydrorhamnose reductase [Gammaproteobacteria bacterium]|nr:dTDP-4-dehydrorhamnose reductase [Gammaproteobacteria bacterium]